jgi:hypothetical protein
LTYLTNELHPISKSKALLLKALEIPIQLNSESLGFQLSQNSYGITRAKYLKSLNEVLARVEQVELFQSYLVYQRIGSEKLKKIKELREKLNGSSIYVLVHRLYDFKKVVEQLVEVGIEPSALILCYNKEMSSAVSLIKGSKLLELSLPERKKNDRKKSRINLIPFALINFLKLLVTPALELKKAYELLKVSQFIGAKRLHELGSLFLFLMRHSYGLVVILYYFVEGCCLVSKDILKVVGIRGYYRIRHPFFIAYGRCVDLYYALFCVLKSLLYFLTHIVPYPLYKMYWFLEFQYHKRIRRSLWTE